MNKEVLQRCPLQVSKSTTEMLAAEAGGHKFELKIHREKDKANRYSLSAETGTGTHIVNVRGKGSARGGVPMVIENEWDGRTVLAPSAKINERTDLNGEICRMNDSLFLIEKAFEAIGKLGKSGKLGKEEADDLVGELHGYLGNETARLSTIVKVAEATGYLEDNQDAVERLAKISEILTRLGMEPAS